MITSSLILAGRAERAPSMQVLRRHAFLTIVRSSVWHPALACHYSRLTAPKGGDRRREREPNRLPRAPTSSSSSSSSSRASPRLPRPLRLDPASPGATAPGGFDADLDGDEKEPPLSSLSWGSKGAEGAEGASRAAAPVPPAKIVLDCPKGGTLDRHLRLELQRLPAQDPVRIAITVDRHVQAESFAKAKRLLEIVTTEYVSKKSGGRAGLDGNNGERDGSQEPSTAMMAAKYTVAWNYLLDGLMKKGHWKTAWSVFNDMKKRSVPPSSHTFTILLRGLARLPRPVPEAAGTLACQIYEQLKARNRPCPRLVVHTNAALTACSAAGHSDGFWAILSGLPQRGAEAPDEKTYTTVLQQLLDEVTGSAPLPGLTRPALGPGREIGADRDRGDVVAVAAEGGTGAAKQEGRVVDLAAQAETQKLQNEKYERLVGVIGQALDIWNEIRRKAAVGDVKLDERLIHAQCKLLLVCAQTLQSGLWWWNTSWAKSYRRDEYLNGKKEDAGPPPPAANSGMPLEAAKMVAQIFDVLEYSTGLEVRVRRRDMIDGFSSSSSSSSSTTTSSNPSEKEDDSELEEMKKIKSLLAKTEVEKEQTPAPAQITATPPPSVPAPTKPADQERASLSKVLAEIEAELQRTNPKRNAGRFVRVPMPDYVFVGVSPRARPVSIEPTNVTVSLLLMLCKIVGKKSWMGRLFDVFTRGLVAPSDANVDRQQSRRVGPSDRAGFAVIPDEANIAHMLINFGSLGCSAEDINRFFTRDLVGSSDLSIRHISLAARALSTAAIRSRDPERSFEVFEKVVFPQARRAGLFSADAIDTYVGLSALAYQKDILRIRKWATSTEASRESRGRRKPSAVGTGGQSSFGWTRGEDGGRPEGAKDGYPLRSSAEAADLASTVSSKMERIIETALWPLAEMVELYMGLAPPSRTEGGAAAVLPALARREKLRPWTVPGQAGVEEALELVRRLRARISVYMRLQDTARLLVARPKRKAEPLFAESGWELPGAQAAGKKAEAPPPLRPASRHWKHQQGGSGADEGEPPGRLRLSEAFRERFAALGGDAAFVPAVMVSAGIATKDVTEAEGGVFRFLKEATLKRMAQPGLPYPEPAVKRVPNPEGALSRIKEARRKRHSSPRIVARK